MIVVSNFSPACLSTGWGREGKLGRFRTNDGVTDEPNRSTLSLYSYHPNPAVLLLTHVYLITQQGHRQMLS